MSDTGRNIINENQPAPVASTSNCKFDYDRDSMEAEKQSRYTVVECVEVLDAVIEKNSELDKNLKELGESLSRALEAIDKELAEYEAERKAAAEGLAAQSSESEDYDDDDDFQVMGIGRPYFRDETGATPPDNEDTLAMKAFNMLDFSQLTVSNWTIGQKNNLLSILLAIFKSKIKTKLHNQLSILQKTEKKTKEFTEKIEHINKELMSMKNITLDNSNLPENYEFDWDDVAMELHGNHSPQECKSVWELFFHPNVNKTPWSRQEHKNLLQIAAKMKFQNWEAIAKELKNNRTGYQCFVYIRKNVNHIGTGHSWTQEELTSLKEVIEEYTKKGLIQWGRVTAAMHNRTKRQCYNMYMKLVLESEGIVST